MNKKNEGIRIKRAAHGMICNIIPHPKEGKPILILYSNQNMKWDI